MQLFASYSRRDSTVVEALIKDLERAHLSVWHDQDLHGGDRWWSDILGRIRDCDVFLFVLSQHSLGSKPCQAELSYARALGLPIVPVQVGHVPGLRLSPVADIQVIDYQERTRSEGMALLDAILASAPRRGPLPDPLPEPPPVPFEYLVRLGSAISAQQLSPDEQGTFIRQLAECVETEDDESAKEDARELLQALLRRPDITVRNAKAAEALLADVAPEEPDGPRAGVVWRGLPRREKQREKKPTGRHGAHGRRDSRHPESARSGVRSKSEPALPRRPLSGTWTAAERKWGRPRVMGILGVVGVLLLGLGFPLGNPVLFRSFNAVFRPTTPVVFQAEPAGVPGKDAFTEPASREEAQQVPVGTKEAGSSGQNLSGQQPGLYGGTTTNTCDSATIADYLEGQPDRARAWAGAFQPPPSQIRSFLAELTPVTLRTDTLVTNHGFKNNAATRFQSLLQAGTAVLVDARGVPRVRCACGNPLAAPEHVDRPSYDTKTPPWKDYSPRTVTTITEAPAAVKKFLLVQPGSEEVVTRPVGTSGEQDAPATPEEAQAARSLTPLPPSERATGEPPSDGQRPGETPGKGSSGGKGSSEDPKHDKQVPGDPSSSSSPTPTPSSVTSTSPDSPSPSSPFTPRSHKRSKDLTPPSQSSPTPTPEDSVTPTPSSSEEPVPGETPTPTPTSSTSEAPVTSSPSETSQPSPDDSGTLPSSGESVTPPPPEPPTPDPQPPSKESVPPDPQPSDPPLADNPHVPQPPPGPPLPSGEETTPPNP